MKTVLLLISLALLSGSASAQNSFLPKSSQETKAEPPKPIAGLTFRCLLCDDLQRFPDRFRYNDPPLPYAPEEHHELGKGFTLSVSHGVVLDANNPRQIIKAANQTKTRFTFNIAKWIPSQGFQEWMGRKKLILGITSKMNEFVPKNGTNPNAHRLTGRSVGIRLSFLIPY